MWRKYYSCISFTDILHPGVSCAHFCRVPWCIFCFACFTHRGSQGYYFRNSVHYHVEKCTSAILSFCQSPTARQTPPCTLGTGMIIIKIVAQKHQKQQWENFRHCQKYTCTFCKCTLGIPLCGSCLVEQLVTAFFRIFGPF